MTIRDYLKAKKVIRKNRKSNLKLGQNISAANTEYARAKAVEKSNKNLDKSNKKQAKEIKKQNKIDLKEKKKQAKLEKKNA